MPSMPFLGQVVILDRTVSVPSIGQSNCGSGPDPPSAHLAIKSPVTRQSALSSALSASATTQLLQCRPVNVVNAGADRSSGVN